MRKAIKGLVAVVRQQFCNGDQLFDFSVPELVQSTSTFSTDPEVLQNCAGFTLCSSADLGGYKMEKSGQPDGNRHSKSPVRMRQRGLLFSISRSASSRRMFCSNGFDTMYVVCTDSLCVVCSGLLSAEFSTVNTELGRPMFGKRMCLFSTPEGLAAINYHLLDRLLKFSTQKWHIQQKINPKMLEALSELLISSFISSKPRQHSIVFHNVLV